MTRLSVSKWQGTGNDFVLFDNVSGADYPYARLAKTLCDRRFGVGADGLIVTLPARNGEADLAMRIFNADGSEAQTCGNGIRCVALEYRVTRGRDDLKLETASGLVEARVLSPKEVRVNMGKPRLLRRDIPMAGPPTSKAIGAPIEIGGRPLYVCALSMGNPHCVIFADADTARSDLAALAAALNDETLFPDGVNVELVDASARNLSVRVIERGVGETWACGSGACAAAVASVLTGRAQSPIEVAMRGGTVLVEWAGADADVFLTGPAKRIFQTDVEVDV